jgi:hypothetical protein
VSDEFISFLLQRLNFGAGFSRHCCRQTMKTNLEIAKSRREELFELIAVAANEIASIDRSLTILYSQAQEADLLQGEEKALA